MIRESADRALGRRRRSRRGLRVRGERSPAALPPEDRAARRLELLDQGPAGARVRRARAGRRAPTVCSSTACRRGCAPSTTRPQRTVGQPIVTTCYSSSQPAVIEEAADNGSAYIYLVVGVRAKRNRRAARPQRAGRRSGDPARAHRHPDRRRLRGQDEGRHRGLGEVGADAAIVGSACVACVADALANGRDVVEDFQALLVELGAAPQLTGAGLPSDNQRSNQEVAMLIRKHSEVKTVEWGNGPAAGSCSRPTAWATP